MGSVRASTARWSSWSALALVPGCLALSTGRVQTHIETGTTVVQEAHMPLDGVPPRRVVHAQVRGPWVQAELADERSCVVHRTARSPRRAVAKVGYPDWARWATAAEALLGLGAVVAAPLQPQSDGRKAVGAVIGAALLVDALASVLAKLGAWQRPPPPTDLPADVQHLLPRVLVCGVDLPAGATVEAHSRRGVAQSWTDGRGRASWDVRTWPPGQFPYAAPLATLHCSGCDPVELYLDATTAAALVRERNDPDDLAAWLDVHGLTAEAPTIRRQHDRLLRAIADQQDDALRQARRAVDDGDLVLAARLARGCVQLARVPAPACEQLLAQIDDRFVQQQVAIGDWAIARQHWQTARDAHYRCRLVDRNRPSCAELGHRLDMAQLRAHRAAFEAALLRGDPGAAERALRGILQFANDTPLAADAQGRLEALRRTVAQGQADELARRAAKWVRKRKWARALVLLQACHALPLADTRACGALADRLPKGLGGP